MPSPLNPFAKAARQSVAAALGLDPELLAVTAPPRPELGDFAVGCFPAAKLLRKPPPAIAAQVVEAFAPTELLAEASAAGPFVNFRANRAAAFAYLFANTAPDGTPDALPPLIPTDTGAGKTVCIDYSSPNISKHLAYHHIRSTVIGHALANLYRAVGYRVVGINHLGDWGTTHGMLLAAQELWGAPDPLTINSLNELYVRFRQAMKTDPALEEKGRVWFKRLEDGDPEARDLWQRFRDVSWAEFQAVYDDLGIQFEEVRGESAYQDDIEPVIDMLSGKGLTQESQGALVVPLDDGDEMPPLLLRKKDGATLYATRDLAAAIYRWKTYAFARNLYVVDRGQALHFKQLFRTLEKAGYEWAERCDHVPFGLVRIGGKKTGTRTGNVVLLKEVLAEARERSVERIREANPDWPDEQVRETARQVGIGAVVFANLVSQREKDVDFEWDDVLSVQGDSGPYVQYAHARCSAILRKAGEIEPSAAADATRLAHEQEWQVARKLLELGETAHRAAENNDPHVLSRYLLDLCAGFSQWYTSGNHDASLRVLCDDPDTARARVALVAAVRWVLRTGLEALGLEAPEAM